MLVKPLLLIGALISALAVAVAHAHDPKATSRGASFAAEYRSTFNSASRQDRLGARMLTMSCLEPTTDGVYRCRVRIRMADGELACGQIGVTVLHAFTYRHYQRCRPAH